MRGAWSWRNAAWLDYYDAEDTGKEEGLEPTLAYSMFHWSERSWGQVKQTGITNNNI